MATSAIQPTCIGSQLHIKINDFNVETAETAFVPSTGIKKRRAEFLIREKKDEQILERTMMMMMKVIFFSP